MLTIDDFEKIKEANHLPHYYYSYKIDDDYELCLEPCVNGYCVGLYKHLNLIGNKTCTLMFCDWPKALSRALEIANQKLKELSE